jgi:hypothetical protein
MRWRTPPARGNIRTPRLHGRTAIGTAKPADRGLGRATPDRLLMQVSRRDRHQPTGCAIFARRGSGRAVCGPVVAYPGGHERASAVSSACMLIRPFLANQSDGPLFQTDYASSILVARSTGKGPGQRGLDRHVPVADVSSRGPRPITAACAEQPGRRHLGGVAPLAAGSLTRSGCEAAEAREGSAL